MVNCNPDTGIRYGVIAVSSLNQDLAHELWYGSGARDLSYEAALAELRADMTAQADRIEEEAIDSAARAARETGITDAEALANLEAQCIEAAYESQGFADREDFVEAQVERLSEHIEIDQPIIQGTCDGVTYQIGWLGGAPLLTVLHGPVGWAWSLCSPCVPGAADLDSGFDVALAEGELRTGYQCYVVPKEWLA